MVKNILLTSVLFSLTVNTTFTHAKEYYRWVDAKGSTHYTTTPPPKNARKKGKVETYGTVALNSTPAPAPTQNTQPTPENASPQSAPTNNQTPADLPTPIGQ